MLDWNELVNGIAFDNVGRWAISHIAKIDGFGAAYRIRAVGSAFDISDSEGNTLPDVVPDPFPTLADAMAWCEGRERELIDAKSARHLKDEEGQ